MNYTVILVTVIICATLIWISNADKNGKNGKNGKDEE